MYNVYNQRSYLQYRLKLSYEDRILENTNQWIYTNDLVRRVKGSKSGIVEAIHDLTKNEYLESKKESNMIFYKRKDDVVSNEGFKRLMSVHQWNYDQILNAIKKTPKLSTKKGKLSSKAKPIVKHLEYLLDRDSILMARINYQKNLEIIPKKIAYQRISMINELVTKVMKTINTKYEKDITLIQESFQNHEKKLTFKI